MEPRADRRAEGNGRADYGAFPPPSSLEERGFTPPGTVVGQLKCLLSDARLLARQELELARAEMNEKVSQAKRGAGFLAAAGGLVFAGVLGLCAAAMWLLAIWMPLWLSALIVSGIVLLAGGVLFTAGRKDVEPKNLTFDRTVDSLRRDQRLVKEHLR
jgi:uncharacterized membrane protein YqjE